MSLEDLIPYLPLFPTTTIAIVSIIVYFKNERKDRMAALEQNFEVLQQFNELALQSDDNLIAAMKSVVPDDELTAERARIVFFHYLRMNRMLRAYEFGRVGALRNSDVERIIDSYAPALKEAAADFHVLRQRGYPEDFIDFVSKRIEKFERAPRLDGN